MKTDPGALLNRVWPLIPHCVGMEQQISELTLQGLEQQPEALVRLVRDEIYPIQLDDWDYPHTSAEQLEIYLAGQVVAKPFLNRKCDIFHGGVTGASGHMFAGQMFGA